MRQKSFKLQERRLWGRGGSVRRVVTDWTGVHRHPRRRVAARSNPDHCIEDWPKIAIRATQARRCGLAPFRFTAPIWEEPRRGEGAAGSAQALDRDEFIAGRTAGRHRLRPGDVPAVDLAK